MSAAQVPDWLPPCPPITEPPDDDPWATEPPVPAPPVQLHTPTGNQTESQHTPLHHDRMAPPGVERKMVDLDNGTLTIEDTRVVVRGRAEASDGKSESNQRDISLDSFTVRHLRSYVDRMNEEREAFGDSYPNHDYLMVGPEGRPLHPDTITARFNRLVDQAGVPRIRLHDVRHTYATMAQDAGHNIKTLSERIGHADVTVTGKIYMYSVSRLVTVG